jgi:hypothetical protein
MSSNGFEHSAIEELGFAQVGNKLASIALLRKSKAAMFARGYHHPDALILDVGKRNVKTMTIKTRASEVCNAINVSNPLKKARLCRRGSKSR